MRVINMATINECSNYPLSCETKCPCINYSLKHDKIIKECYIILIVSLITVVLFLMLNLLF